MDLEPERYLLRSGPHTLAAQSLEELAELIECTLEAGHPIDAVRARELRERPLERQELGRLLRLLSDP